MGSLQIFEESDQTTRTLFVTTRDLREQVGRQNLAREMESGDPHKMLDRQATSTRNELKDLETALSVGDLARALFHAENALRTGR